MKELVFATNNPNKLKEIRNKLGSGFKVLSLKDISFSGDIPETNPTLEENALQKAEFIYNKYNINCFADDTGLEIDALDGCPGVYSARYAGEACNAEDNMKKVLEEMKGVVNRKGVFKTVISLIINDSKHSFIGTVEGLITEQKKGKKGFGYDPIFMPSGYDKTFAQMTMDEKNSISHRARAVEKLAKFLKSIG